MSVETSSATSQPEVPLFRTDLFTPRYRPLRHGDWELRLAEMNFASGYWSGTALVRGMAVLLRKGVSWMSMTPMELESQEIGVRLARGHVLVFGLGLGWSAAASALRGAVSAVTVIELDPDVLALHRELDVFGQLPAEARAKVRILAGDAYAYVPDRSVDVLMPDIWLPLVSDDRVEEVRRMQANVRARAVYFWGQEMEIARHAIAARRALDADGIAATVADLGLPLLGPELPDHSSRLEAVARRWMRGRWLPGTVAPPW